MNIEWTGDASPAESHRRQTGDPARLRSEILALLTEGRRPRKAYELINMLERRLQRRFSPPTLYRALRRLVGEGVVARIQSRDAYVTVDRAASGQHHAFLLCEGCGQAFEFRVAPLAEANRAAERLGFRIGRAAIEFEGVCRDCRTTEIGHRRSSAIDRS